MKKNCIHLFCLIVAFFSLFGKGNGQTPQVIITEINYHSDSTLNPGDWVELYNLSGSSVDLTNWIFSDSESNHFYILPSGTTINSGEYLILSQDTTLFRSYYSGSIKVKGPFIFGLSNKGEVLRLFDFQNNLHTSVTYADSLSWPKGADGHGRTMERLDYNTNPDVPSNWFDGCILGSPGLPYQQCDPDIIFSEINYNSDFFADAGDWVELRNVSSQPIDLSGWNLSDKKDSLSFAFPSGQILQPGDNLVVAGNMQKFNSEFPFVTNVTGPFPFGLKNSKDILRLKDGNGILNFSVEYNNDPPWPAGPDGDGYTLEIVSATGKMNDGSNWFEGCKGGSPGYYYTQPCNALSVEENAASFYEVFPVPATSAVRIKNAFLNNGKIDFYDISGKQILFSVTRNGNDAVISVVDASRGMYFFIIKNESLNISGKGKIIVE